MVKRKGTSIGDDEDLAPHYARILGRHIPDPHISQVLRTSLRGLPRRLPVGVGVRRDVAELVERVLRVGEVGTLDITGTPREIDVELANALGEPAGDPRRTYRALRALLGRTVLVERPSRQVWTLRLSGLSDPDSPLHRALIAETPAPYRLPPATTDTSPALLVELQRALEDERARRVRAEQDAQAARDEVVELRRSLADEQLRRIDAETAARKTEVARPTGEPVTPAVPLAPETLPDEPPGPPAPVRPPLNAADQRRIDGAALFAARMFGFTDENTAKAIEHARTLDLVPPANRSRGKGHDKRKRRRAR